MNDGTEADKFLQAVNKACGELNEAARLSNTLFEGEERRTVRRELARLMEQIETRILPIFREHHPGAKDE